MIDLHYWPTPNGHKISIMLEECALPYQVVMVDIRRGAQFTPEFLAISPNNRMPAIVDHEPMGGGEPIAIFESAAILQYLAEKSGQFLPTDPRGKYEALQWLAWQVANLGPMAGNYNHFANYAVESVPYAVERFRNEVNRLLGVLDRRLSDRPFLAGAYSIADMATWPWVFKDFKGEAMLDGFPHVRSWWEEVAARPAVQKGRAVGKEQAGVPMDDDARKVLFGQTAASVRDAEATRSTR